MQDKQHEANTLKLLALLKLEEGKTFNIPEIESCIKSGVELNYGADYKENNNLFLSPFIVNMNLYYIPCEVMFKVFYLLLKNGVKIAEEEEKSLIILRSNILNKHQMGYHYGCIYMMCEYIEKRLKTLNKLETDYNQSLSLAIRFASINDAALASTSSLLALGCKLDEKNSYTSQDYILSPAWYFDDMITENKRKILNDFLAKTQKRRAKHRAITLLPLPKAHEDCQVTAKTINDIQKIINEPDQKSNLAFLLCIKYKCEAKILPKIPKVLQRLIIEFKNEFELYADISNTLINTEKLKDVSGSIN